MAGVSEAAHLERLEIQVENGGGGAWEYLCLVRKLKARRSDKVLKHGLSILNDPKTRSKLGGEEWALYEQVALAAMDCQQHDVAKDCVEVLSKEFPGSTRIGKLEGMLLEARGAWAEAEKVYARILEESPLDQVIHKRKVAMAKAQGDFSAAVNFLNKYLEIFMADHDAWRELAEIYVSLQMYKQAAFCYEELILSHPTVPPYHLAYAEILYTMGGLENFQIAKKYYASAITLTGERTLGHSMVYACAAINQLTKGRSKEEKESSDLQSLAAEALQRDYKEKVPKKLPLLTSMLKNMKLSS